MKKKLVILSGAGISAESGIATFRDNSDSLWNNHKIEDVCTSSAWETNPKLVNQFYNDRRKEVLNASPNLAHIALAEAEEHFNIQVITQNVDDLHERSGSTNVLHLHGEILKARSSNPCYDWAGMSPDPKINSYKTYPIGYEGIKDSDQADDGFPLRPDIVFFGETVPKIIDAEKEMQEAQAVIVVGTSLNVYPAAGLLWQVGNAPVWTVDPNIDLDSYMSFPTRIIKAKATVGIPIALKEIKKYFEDNK